MGYLIGGARWQASNSRLQYLLTLAVGTLKECELSKNDLSNIAEIHHKMEAYLHNRNSGSYESMMGKNFSRIGRSLIFVKQAREARNLAYKISNYCSALETLFTTDSVELSHKLSECAAFFIRDSSDKLQTCKDLKKAYTIRSKLTHGASIDAKNIEQIPSIAFNTDNILRTIFNKIISSEELLELFDSNNVVVDEYFEKLIFN